MEKRAEKNHHQPSAPQTEVSPKTVPKHQTLGKEGKVVSDGQISDRIIIRRSKTRRTKRRIEEKEGEENRNN